MKRVELKDINFSEFKAKLIKNSHNFGYKVKERDNILVITIDDNWLGVSVDVEFYELDERFFLYVLNTESLLRIVIILCLFMLAFLYGHLLLSIVFSIVLAILIFATVRLQTIKKVDKLILEISELPKSELVNIEDGQGERIEGLVCPACGERLTEYDEYCPSCGLYLGKVWKRQPATRTGFKNMRLEYRLKKSGGKGN